jgi:hypothetical protein
MNAAAARHEVLPSSLAPRGLSRGQAAAYVGVGVTKFGQMVSDGRMPRPKALDCRLVWDRYQLDEAFEALPESDREGHGDGPPLAESLGDDPWSDVRA